MNDIKRSEELFEALGELDDDLIAYAKHIGCCGENVIVLKKLRFGKRRRLGALLRRAWRSRQSSEFSALNI